MKMSTITLVLTVLSMPLVAQTADERSVLEPVHHLFQGMKSGDSSVVHSVFSKEVTFVTIATDKNGRPIIKQDPLKEFLVAIGSPHPETWNEVLWDTRVNSDGNFAQVWANYGFYIGKKFSHCGVDAFHLFKGVDGKWRIFHLADTRHREGCQVPPSVSEQFK